ncbi:MULTISPECIES: type I-F CRISPR-associated endoribonuclease Cas6/Csy4 [Acinetobacter]|jgi:CRISPR-associated endonuclease Csy4|uniref:CRISPR-associated protein, Csy4 family n=1 Tax=Acinetobacter junii CIP 107470 = MTCC 11364 TaxID=1217666 RepID=S7XPY6_ACIJU|nr:MULTISPECIES: type I-F CRISPR-associated endoribonuclease Cas6/Csy4 [Acinetobacter]ENV52232.1 CRISPR-associated protein cas6/csy4, subtype I-f/ypest [Acinetobacter junii CIP 107470 = MTCC 11364]EPR81194.1 CRISPR-associated protein, Csy4 family [Acinetobacter junii CIP 107470 = MTCC 11364]NAR77719.1 type I-F CRISPR-associated endoribonuclease Cas6/Csy4 [Acinetobacter haemolyticus]RSN74999.1 type I-F CRISPR-associated endoribonuclease Cas6/Csy4 [Acinetobacter haemolyticus]
MKFYQEITLIDQAEISPYFIWSKLYTQLHIALAEIKDDSDKVGIGASFPQYIFEEKVENQKARINLGNKLRLFAESEADLKKLDIRKWLERLEDYVHITSIREVPSDIKGYAIYKRKQVKTNAQRLARHRIKRGDIGFDEALARYSNVVTTTNFPYIEMKSLSTSDQQSEKRFKLFIEKQPAEKTETQVFSTYGLSSVSSVPEF